MKHSTYDTSLPEIMDDIESSKSMNAQIEAINKAVSMLHFLADSFGIIGMGDTKRKLLNIANVCVRAVNTIQELQEKAHSNIIKAADQSSANMYKATFAMASIKKD